HRDSVACDTHTSFASAIALTAPRPVIRFTMLALKAVEYVISSRFHLPPSTSSGSAHAGPIEAATSLTQGGTMKRYGVSRRALFERIERAHLRGGSDPELSEMIEMAQEFSGWMAEFVVLRERDQAGRH